MSVQPRHAGTWLCTSFQTLATFRFGCHGIYLYIYIYSWSYLRCPVGTGVQKHWSWILQLMMPLVHRPYTPTQCTCKENHTALITNAIVEHICKHCYVLILISYTCSNVCIYGFWSKFLYPGTAILREKKYFRELHVYLSRGPCWPTTPLMKIRSPPPKLRQRITGHFLIAF